MQINPVYDTSVSNAPSGFTQAVQAAVAYFDNLITNNISISINFGWGEVNGQALAANALGENLANGYMYSYSQVAQGLTASASSADDRAAVATLPGSDPTGGAQFFVTTPEAVALGLTHTVSSPAGWIGLNSSFQYTFDPANRAVPNLYDAVGVLEHEISEVLGRIGSLGSAIGGDYTPFDLFRYSAPGARALTAGPGYFSVDGSTLLLPFNNPNNGGDAGDWNSTVLGDSFGPGMAGHAGVVSATDLKALDVLGYTLQGASLPAPVLVATSPSNHALGVALGAPIVLSFNEAVARGSGSIQLHDATTGAVLDTIAITDTSQVRLNAATFNIHPTGGLPAGASVYVTVDPGAITDLSGTPFGGVSSATTFAFTDVSASQATSDLISNTLRASAVSGPYASLGAQLTNGLSGGTVTFPAAQQSVIQTAGATTSVAVLSYEFFTGSTPSAAGLDYLVAPAGPNPNNLNSAYYQSFNDTNRFINFAVNLGKAGAGASAFLAHYGALSLADATSQEYATIFGTTPTAAKVDALLNTQVTLDGVSMTRADYLAMYGGDGLNGIGTKAAVAGWLMAEAVHAGVGTYATAEASYLNDLSQGHATYGIDLVGVYHGTPYTGG